MMFFTDDEHEPKKINIQQCIDGTADFDTHTQINGEDFKEEHITVIKKSPKIHSDKAEPKLLKRISKTLSERLAFGMAMKTFKIKHLKGKI